MTAKTDAKAATTNTTATAQAASTKAGANVTNLMQHLQLKIDEIQVLVRQIIAITPNGDANLTALNNLLSELL